MRGHTDLIESTIFLETLQSRVNTTQEVPLTLYTFQLVQIVFVLKSFTDLNL